MFKSIDLYTKRYWQITMAFMIFAFIDQVFHIPHSSWVIITGAMLYSGFNPGTVLKRGYLRFLGTIVGVAAINIMWHFIHWDFRLATIFLIIICWGITFFVALPYNRYMIIVTLFSDGIIQWADTSGFNIEFYTVDRLVCTLLVFVICILVEFLWFGRSNMTYLNYVNLSKLLKDDVQELYQITQKRELSSGKIFKQISAITTKVDRLNTLVNDAKYEDKKLHEFSEVEKQFGHQVVLVFRKVVSLHYLKLHDKDNPIIPTFKLQVEREVNSL